MHLAIHFITFVGLKKKYTIMVTEQLISPKSIVVVGGSEDTTKPGGSALKNLIDNNYSGKLYVVNPKAENVQWQKTYKSVEELRLSGDLRLPYRKQYCSFIKEKGFIPRWLHHDL